MLASRVEDGLILLITGDKNGMLHRETSGSDSNFFQAGQYMISIAPHAFTNYLLT